MGDVSLETLNDNIEKDDYCAKNYYIETNVPIYGAITEKCQKCPDIVDDDGVCLNVDNGNKCPDGGDRDTCNKLDKCKYVYTFTGEGKYKNKKSYRAGTTPKKLVLTPTEKSDIRMCGNLYDTPGFKDEFEIDGDKDAWMGYQKEKKIQEAHAAQNASHQGKTHTDFKSCVYDKLRINPGKDNAVKKDERLNLLMNAPYRKIHSCLEETDVKKNCRDGYSSVLIDNLLGEDQYGDVPKTDKTDMDQTAYKTKLTKRHLFHLAARMEHNDCGFVTENTEMKKDAYDANTFTVNFPSMDILTFLNKLAGTDEMDKGWISSGLRIISFLAVALVIYMFLRIIVK